MKLLIVDTHELLREGLAAFLGQSFPAALVLQAATSAAGLAVIDEHRDVDLVILDLAGPGRDGLPMIPEFRKRRPAPQIVVMSETEEPEQVRTAFTLGARGYVGKAAPRETLLAALRLVLDGHRYIPELMLNQWSTVLPSRPQLLTTRQLEVLQELARGRSNGEIAAALGIAEKTVKTHVTDIFQALRVGNRTQAVAVARLLGLIKDG